MNQNLSNICRVTKETHIDQIIAQHKNKILMIVFSYENPKLNKFMKHEVSQQFKDCYFVMVLLDRPNTNKYNFIPDKNGWYFADFKGKQLPIVVFYYNGKKIANITSAEPAVMLDTLIQLRTIFISSQNKVNEVDQPTPTQPNQTTQPNQITQPNQATTPNQMFFSQNKMAHDHVVEKMSQMKKIHEIEELQKLHEMKEKQEKLEQMNKEDSPENKTAKKKK